MTIWVDADACPGPIKEILFRAAARHDRALVLVANSAMHLPPQENLRLELVPQGADAADDCIAEACGPGDLVVTADVPLAARVVQAGAAGLNPRGELYTEANVEECLARRNFMEELRSAGLAEGGPAALQPTDRKRFADALERFLSRPAGG
jgi:uncharacterized protein YaiI (UPF0178 family)